jgi:hypothetical protein
MSEGTIDTFRRKEYVLFLNFFRWVILICFLYLWRRLNSDVAGFIENAQHSKEQPTLIRQMAFVVFGNDIPAKSIQNMRQKISGLFDCLYFVSF